MSGTVTVKPTWTAYEVTGWSNKNCGRDDDENDGYYYFFIPSGVKIPRVKSKVKSKRKAEVVTPRR